MSNQEIHTDLDRLFAEIEELTKIDTDEARNEYRKKMTIALDLMSKENNQIRKDNELY